MPVALTSRHTSIYIWAIVPEVSNKNGEIFTIPPCLHFFMKESPLFWRSHITHIWVSANGNILEKPADFTASFYHRSDKFILRHIFCRRASASCTETKHNASFIEPLICVNYFIINTRTSSKICLLSVPFHRNHGHNIPKIHETTDHGFV